MRTATMACIVLLACVSTGAHAQALDDIDKSLQSGEYESGAGQAREMLKVDDLPYQDCKRCGDVLQLAGDWESAVVAYKKAIGRIDMDFAPKPRMTIVDGVVDGRRNGPMTVEPREPSDVEKENLLRRRLALGVWVSKMQAEMLDDPAAAAETLRDLVGRIEASGLRINTGYWQPAQKLARRLAEAGELEQSIQAWERCLKLYEKTDPRFRNTLFVDVDHIFACLRGMPSKTPWPTVPWITVCPEDKPVVFDFDDLAKAGHPYKDQRVYQYYAFAPPRGKEFAKIAFACDVEQNKVRFGGQFRCFVVGRSGSRRKDLGSMHWKDKQTGRKVLTETISVPAGVGLIHVKIGRPTKGEFRVHSLSVQATCRPITKDAKPIETDAWMQTEFIPKTVHATWGEKTLKHERAYSGLKTGSGTVRVASADGKQSVEFPLEIKPGRRYGLFVNLDSPFRWRQLPMRGARNTSYGPSASIARLSQKRGYLAVWIDSDLRMHQSVSKDLQTWSTPQPCPFAPVFEYSSPATFASADGKVYVAFLSNRLGIDDPNNAHFALFLTSTRDGKTWDPVWRMPLHAQIGSHQPCSLTLLASPDGREWIFWSTHAACAKSLRDIDTFQRARREHPPDPNQPHLSWSASHVVYDARLKQFRRVSSWPKMGTFEQRSEDGWTWSGPIEIIPEGKLSVSPMTHYIQAGDATFLVRKDRLVRIDGNGSITLDSPGMKIANHVVPLITNQPMYVGDEVVLIAGNDTKWLLRAKVADLLKATEKTPQTE